MQYKEVKGDLIKLAQIGTFDVIAHGCNCHCAMGAGIAPQMAKAFGADKFQMERPQYAGEVNKLGTIDYEEFEVSTMSCLPKGYTGISTQELRYPLTVVNAYTQFGFGANHKGGQLKPVDYEAITLAMRKMNHIFKGKHIGLPKIGCGLAGGSWKKVKNIIKRELHQCDVTIVIYKP